MYVNIAVLDLYIVLRCLKILRRLLSVLREELAAESYSFCMV